MKISVQIMSALTGCISGARATGLVDPDVRSDAYTEVTEAMKKILGTSVSVTRQQAKDALMKSFYGSKAEPIKIFGEDTPELSAFYQAATTVAPGAWGLLQELLASWNPMALVHSWKLPDGFDARVKVMETVEARIEIDELAHSTFSYQYQENVGKKKGLSNAANVVHSIDAYVLRCVHRRCNYDLGMVTNAALMMEEELAKRKLFVQGLRGEVSEKVTYYVAQYERSGIADVVILSYLTKVDMGHLTTEHLKALANIAMGMLMYKPFEVVTIHDEFKAHGNNMNHLRKQYANVLADLADSELLSDLLSQLTGTKGTYKKLSNNLSTSIRSSSYALC